MNNHLVQPPKWADRFLEWFCDPNVLEDIQGDIYELFYLREKKLGLAKAKRRFIWDVFCSCKPANFKPLTFTNHPIMLRNYFKIAFRNFRKQKLYSFINVFGLAVGIAFCLMVYLFIQQEISFDRFHVNADHLYRMHAVEYKESGGKVEQNWLGESKPKGLDRHVYLPMPLGPSLKVQFPEIHQYSRFTADGGIVSYENKIHSEYFHFVDSNFLEMFSFPLMVGNPFLALATKDKIVLSEEMAVKYFGTQDPIGKTLEVSIFGEKGKFIVGGVTKKLPDNSSIEFDFLLRIEAQPYYKKNLERWSSFNTTIFLELAASTNFEAFNEKLQTFTQDRFAQTIERSRTNRKLKAEDKVLELGYLPITAIHLENTIGWQNTGSRMNIFILSGIALLILVMACLNYISLAVTSASGRMLEVGIRKVLGSSRSQLARLFWIEAQILVIVALVLALGLIVFFLPVFNEFVERQLELDVLNNWPILLGIVGVVLLTGFIAGGYPAVFISKFKPVQVLKGNQTYRFNPRFTRAIVVTQFALSVFLIISAITMQQQMRFINEKDLGYNKEQVLVLRTGTGWDNEGERLLEKMKEELKDTDQIKSISGTDNSFNRGFNIYGYEMKNERHTAFIYRVDHDYIKTLGMELVDGRDFSKAIITDNTEAIIINEALAKDVQLENPVGENIPWRKDAVNKVVGVVKDFHVLGLNQPIKPALLHLNKEEGKIMCILVKISPENIPQTIRNIESTWKKIASSQPFKYSFLDEDVADQYNTYVKWTKIVTTSTLFAILIACLGLFGLAGIMAMNKTKEIGVRKVLGAGVYHILTLLNKDLVKLAIIAVLLAAPVSWYIMNQWLDNFEFKITMGWSAFFVGAILCLFIALLTVSYHTIKAAIANPIDSIRYE